MTEQYFLFAYSQYYPRGGSEDCKGIFADIEDAKAAGAALAEDYDYLYIEQPHNGAFLEILRWQGEEWVFRG